MEDATFENILFENSSHSDQYGNIFYPIESNDDPSSDDEYKEESKKLIPDDVLWKMFNTGVSFRSLSEILKLAFSMFNAENSFCLSPAHLFQKYKELMQLKENSHRATIEEKKSPGTICFDHQKMSMLNGKYLPKEDRLAIVWHSDGRDNLLAIEKMIDKTGNSQSEAIQQTCTDFQISRDQIVALMFDHAATNVGQYNGTCSILENTFEKPLLRMGCRHHKMEIVIKDVYHYLFNSDAPNNLFYLILKEKWIELRARNFPFMAFDEISYTENFNEEERQAFQQFTENAVNDLKLLTKSKFVRDDYRESIGVCLKLFGENRNNTKSNEVKFRALINPSNARFMSVLIQGIECYLFRNELNFESPEREKVKKNLERFGAFVGLLYIRFWNKCTSLFDSTFNDLQFLQELQKFGQFDYGISQIAISALNRHLYYMSEELSVLSIFSDKITLTEKVHISNILKEMKNKQMPARRNTSSNHIKFSDGNESTDWLSMEVHNLIGDRSPFLFKALNISTSFLEIHPEAWKDDTDYIRAKKQISETLVSINDNSERIISLCKAKNKQQRCRNENSFRRSLIASASKNNN